MSKKYFLLIFILMLGAFSYGIMVIELQIFPYDLFKDIKTKFFNKNINSSIQAELYEDDVSSLVKINNTIDISTKRTLLIQYVWSSVICLS